MENTRYIPLFLQAIAALDAGDEIELDRLLEEHPGLAGFRPGVPLPGLPTESYFRNPCLLWFIADNPIRNGHLPADIVRIAGNILAHLQRHPPSDLQVQLDYALGLVATGRIPKEAGVQIELIDLLIDAGATPGNGIGALANGNPEAARHLIEKSRRLTLAAAAGLGWLKEVQQLVGQASEQEQQLALVVATFYGRTEVLAWLLGLGVNPNVYPSPDSGFHSHGTALHQAVSSRSPEAVRMLIAAGADSRLKDLQYDGTALDWADYLLREEINSPEEREHLLLIAGDLRAL
jgi:hypothetical protein